MKEDSVIVVCLLLATVSSEPAAPWKNGPVWSQQRNFSPSGLTIVNPPQFSPSLRSSRRGGPMPGYLPLRPVPTPRHPRWFAAETAPKPTYLRPPTNNYERYPPYWNEDNMKHAKSRRTHQQHHRHPKKDCNPCNSVPWIPIFKSPVGLSSDHHPRELVPHVEVYPESSVQQPTVLAPAITQAIIPELPPTHVLDPSQDLSTLPIGNTPVAPELLLPPTQAVPFPELSPVQVAPIHQNVVFQSDSLGLVPPPRSSSNVIVTISEHDQHKEHSSTDQDFDSSSLIDSHAPQNYANKYYPPPSGGIDIVKSVPLAEYTSSIEYPFHIIQSPPIIDIHTQFSNASSILHNTYEKQPQTGIQKVSDFVLGITKDTESKKVSVADNDSAGSKQSSQTAAPVTEIFSTPKPVRLNSAYRDLIDPNILTPPPLPPHLTQLLPTIETAYLHPLFPVESRGIASKVNGALLPPPIPQPMNPTTFNPPDTTISPKKIQIIIPYKTINNQDYDQNRLESSNLPVNHSRVQAQSSNAWPPIVVTEATQNQPRKIPATQNFQNFKNNWNDGHQSETNQVKHILASNIRDLLKKEVEPKQEQNIRLQKNIDNWTALEYSNHKIVGKKGPSDVITHAQAVTSIPGTSISHLLLPSKKIPDGYFTTVVAPDFDEPATTAFPTTGVSVNSQPFSTLSMYSTVAHSGSSRSQKTTGSISSTTTRYEVENEIPEETTPGVDWSSLKMSIAPGTNEKVYVVTPVSNWSNSRRSTRHIDVTEKYSPNSQNDINTSTSTETYLNETKSNLTKLEKARVDNSTTESTTEKTKSKNKHLYPKSTPLFRVKGNQTRYDKLSKFNKPKPIEKFFATTTKPITHNVTRINISVSTTSTTSSPTSSTAAIFPFRNGGELPLEMALVNFSSTQLTFKNTGERKTLIKQVKVNNRRGKEESKGSDALPRTTRKVGDSGTVTSTQQTPVMEVDVLLPLKDSGKKGESKKPTSIGKKKPFASDKSSNKTSIKPDEPNITEDDREDINNLMLFDKENETMMAIETSMPRGVFGATRPDNSTRSLLDTIKLLRDFLAETSEEQSQEKSEKIGKVIEKIDAKKDGEGDSDKYKYNFPEYLMGELNLSKDELSLVEGAMLELRKSRARKRLEGN